MNIKGAQRWMTVAAVLTVTSAASANAGTVFASAIAMHLIIGNILLGVIEGLVIRTWFHSPGNRTGLLMIAANFASWLVGVAVLGSVYSSVAWFFPDPT